LFKQVIYENREERLKKLKQFDIQKTLSYRDLLSMVYGGIDFTKRESEVAQQVFLGSNQQKKCWVLIYFWKNSK